MANGNGTIQVNPKTLYVPVTVIGGIIAIFFWYSQVNQTIDSRLDQVIERVNTLENQQNNHLASPTFHAGLAEKIERDYTPSQIIDTKFQVLIDSNEKILQKLEKLEKEIDSLKR